MKLGLSAVARAPIARPQGRDLVVVVLAGMMLLVPALGVPSELVLQDTLKSMLVSFGTLGAALLLVWQGRHGSERLHWHPILWLPLLLMAWALGSMAWAHTYLAAVEAVRWFVFAVLMWVAFSTLTPERLPTLATGIHWGAVMAALWAALQYWLDLRIFPQAAVPASTFANRNFFAEFLVCALPYSALLAAQAQERGPILLRVFTASFLALVVLMTGTRSVLIAWTVLMPVLALILWRYRARLAWGAWSRANRLLALGTLLGTLLGLGSVVPASSPALGAEGLGQTVLERTLVRGQSLAVPAEYITGSASVRLKMWGATARVVLDRPLIGVGAGAWEVEIPLYHQADGQDEVDYYAHNEFLQVLAEYGLTGWVFVIGLCAYLLRAAFRTWRERGTTFAACPMEAPWRATLLASLLALMIVSTAGFPWRLAGTGALFALALGALAASDRQMKKPGAIFGVVSSRVAPMLSRSLFAGLALCMLLAAWISWRAVSAEYHLVRAGQLSLDLRRMSREDESRWRQARDEIVRLTRQGVALHPHYRKITPLIADNLASVEDWANAKWIWASVHQSRPHIVVILANLARASARTGDLQEAQRYFAQAKAISPDAPALRSVEVLLLIRQGQMARAEDAARRYLHSTNVEPELVQYAFVLGMQQKSWTLALESQAVRRRLWPETAPDSWLKTGFVYLAPELNDSASARMAFRTAFDSAPEMLKARVLELIPPEYQDPAHK